MNEKMITKIENIISCSKDELKDAKNKLITQHRHDSDGGWAVISVDDYDSLIDRYECAIEHIGQIIKEKTNMDGVNDE